MDDIINKQNGQVQIIFERIYNEQVFRDALWFLEEEYNALLPEQITQMQDTRFNDWVTVINTIPVEE